MFIIFANKMGRRRQNRIIENLPECKGYKPIGIPIHNLQTNNLLIEEYESIRLLDYEGLSQEDAAIRMGISRPTLTRIYLKARKTIANAIVESKIIMFDGGHFEITDSMINCPSCRRLHPRKNNNKFCNKCD
jgi:uncharacterized protein